MKIRLNERTLRNIVRESVKKMLNERYAAHHFNLPQLPPGYDDEFNEKLKDGDWKHKDAAMSLAFLNGNTPDDLRDKEIKDAFKHHYVNPKTAEDEENYMYRIYGNKSQHAFRNDKDIEYKPNELSNSALEWNDIFNGRGEDLSYRDYPDPEYENGLYTEYADGMDWGSVPPGDYSGEEHFGDGHNYFDFNMKG